MSNDVWDFHQLLPEAVAFLRLQPGDSWGTSGRNTVWEWYFQSHYRLLRAIAARYLRTSDEVDDVILGFVGNRLDDVCKAYRPEKCAGNLARYLHQQFTYYTLDEVKRTVRRGRREVLASAGTVPEDEDHFDPLEFVLEEDPALDPAARARYQALLEALRGCIARCPADQHRVLTMHLLGDMDQPAEISQQLGLPGPRIRKWLQRGLKKVRECLQEQGWQNE
jgi:RNA polymerase sigma factor (sigma-70 family)